VMISGVSLDIGIVLSRSHLHTPLSWPACHSVKTERLARCTSAGSERF
jgi:hypothetical protein